MPTMTETKREIGSGMIKAAADYASKGALPEGVTRPEMIAVVASWCAYIPGSWDKRLGAPTAVRLSRFPERKPAAKTTKTSATKPATTKAATTKRAPASKPATTKPATTKTTRTTRTKPATAASTPTTAGASS